MTRLFSRFEVTAIMSGALLALVVLFAGRFHDIAVPASATLILAMVVWITWRDIADFIIPDGPLVCMAVVGMAVRLAGSPDWVMNEAIWASFDAIACGGALFIVREGYFRLRGIDGIGFGDVKLAAVTGLLIGMTGFAWSLFLASAAGLIVAAFVAVLRPQHRLERLPFGAFLAPLCWVVWVAGLMGAL